jgi:hypothetical protein
MPYADSGTIRPRGGEMKMKNINLAVELLEDLDSPITPVVTGPLWAGSIFKLIVIALT